MEPRALVTRYTLAQIFAEVGAEVLGLLEERASRVVLRKGQSLFAAGDNPRALFAVHLGCLKIVRENPDGESVLLRLVRPGEIVGVREVCLAAVYARSAVALVDTEVFSLDARLCLDLVAREGALGLMFMRMLARELGRLEQRLEAKMHTPAHARVAAVISGLCSLFAKPGTLVFHPPLSRRDIAELADVTPETVSRAISDLKRMGAIETQGARFRVLDAAALETAAAAAFEDREA